MAFGNIGKALVGQALETTKKNMLDGLMTADTPKAGDKPAAPVAPEPVGGVVLAQVQAMQRALREDQELAVFYHAGPDTLRVTDIFVPSLQVLVLAGEDSDRNVTRAIVPAETVQLVCKIVKVQTGAAPVRVTVRSPRPRQEGTA